MSRVKIYLFGKISGVPLEEAIKKFDHYEFMLRVNGFEVVNPLTINEVREGKTWIDYMKTDILELFQCKAIYMIKDWQQSVGAQIEYEIAKNLGLQIIDENDTKNSFFHRG